MEKDTLREINHDFVKYYNFNICEYKKISKKTFLINEDNGKKYIVKKSDQSIENKFNYLKNIGIYSIIYPKENIDRKYLSLSNKEYYYVSEYLEHKALIKELNVLYLYQELRKIHQDTSFKRQLSKDKSRPKFEEITKQLDHKFTIIEDFVRSVESKNLTIFSMPILSNYRYILDAKKELIRLLKLIIVQIKDRISVEYSVIHNNPKLDHILINDGNKFLTSIDNSKLGISSLDMAKLYIESEDLNIDFKTYIVDYYYQYQDSFYYDYFRFLVLYIYIKRLVINNLDYVSAENFINTANSIKRYFEIFLDKQEQISDEDNTNY